MLDLHTMRKGPRDEQQVHQLQVCGLHNSYGFVC
jgi:hypothetical protein